MPRMGGSELLGLIRFMPEGRRQAVIMLSAEQMLDPIYKAYDHGIVEWIPKPFTPATLLTKVGAHLKAPKK
jgi:CheY-like chemotaxis protein